MKFWIEKDDTIFLYQLVKAAGLEDDYAVIRQIIREGKVSVNDQIALSQRQELKVGDTIRYNSIHIIIHENRSKEQDEDSPKSDENKFQYKETIRHGNTQQWSSKPLKDERKLDKEINDLCVQIHKTFVSRKLTLSLAESCTGGMAQSIITAQSGASDYFLGGIVSYSNESKIQVLGVRKEILQNHGAVSSQSANELAAGIQKLMKSDISASVTGIAGPTGGSAEKPVGCVFISVKTKKELNNKKFIFTGNRDKVRKKAVLELFKSILENL